MHDEPFMRRSQGRRRGGNRFHVFMLEIQVLFYDSPYQPSINPQKSLGLDGASRGPLSRTTLGIKTPRYTSFISAEQVVIKSAKRMAGQPPWASLAVVALCPLLGSNPRC
jgi:hypothetical protein